MSLANPIRYVWKTYQILGDLNPPTLNTLHSIISSTSGMRVIAVEVRETNTGTTDEEIDVVIEQDGNTWIYDASVIGVLLHNVKYGFRAMPYNVDQATYDLDAVQIAGGAIPFMIADSGDDQSEPIEGQNVNVQVRQTSAVGAGQRILVKVTYQLLEAI